MKPVFLTLEDIVDFHAAQIAEHGGSLGVRDMEGLKSALAAPQSGMAGRYFHDDVFQMAAAYLFHLVKNHPFVDGNKRAGAIAALVFLDSNGWEPTASNDQVVDLTLGVAESRYGKPHVADFFGDHVKKRRKKPSKNS